MGRGQLRRGLSREALQEGLRSTPGVTYALNPKTVVRAGWGIFYDRAFYPGWGGGIHRPASAATSPSTAPWAGCSRPSYLQDGFPQDFMPPPFIQSDFRNGQDILYRPLDANERPRSQQWNLTVDREISKGFSVGLAYVGSRGSRLPSNNQPLNALDPAAALPGQRRSTTSSRRGRPRCTACPSRIPAGVSR